MAIKKQVSIKKHSVLLLSIGVLAFAVICVFLYFDKFSADSKVPKGVPVASYRCGLYWCNEKQLPTLVGEEEQEYKFYFVDKSTKEPIDKPIKYSLTSKTKICSTQNKKHKWIGGCLNVKPTTFTNTFDPAKHSYFYLDAGLYQLPIDRYNLLGKKKDTIAMYIIGYKSSDKDGTEYVEILINYTMNAKNKSGKVIGGFTVSPPFVYTFKDKKTAQAAFDKFINKGSSILVDMSKYDK